MQFGHAAKARAEATSPATSDAAAYCLRFNRLLDVAIAVLAVKAGGELPGGCEEALAMAQEAGRVAPPRGLWAA